MCVQADTYIPIPFRKSLLFDTPLQKQYNSAAVEISIAATNINPPSTTPTMSPVLSSSSFVVDSPTHEISYVSMYTVMIFANMEQC